MQNEIIVAAAILHDGKVYTGKRHCSIIQDIIRVTGVSHVGGDSPQGFTTNTGRFVDRVEGLAIAKTNNQNSSKALLFDILKFGDFGF